MSLPRLGRRPVGRRRPAEIDEPHAEIRGEPREGGGVAHDAFAGTCSGRTTVRATHSRAPLWTSRGRLRTEWHRSTMAHLESLYPFQVDAGFGERGPYLGVNVTGGMSGFFFDPFELYGQGTLTGPNCLVIGEVGTGKSATVKAFLRRSLAVYGQRRLVIILDPKGEYEPLAATHGLAVIRLRPGGSDRLNLMAPSPGSAQDITDDLVCRQSLASALVAAVLRRPLEPVEDAVLGWAVTSLARSGRPFTLRDVATAVVDPAEDLVELCRLGPAELTHAATPVVLGLDKLCNRTLAGMFDGPTTVDIDWNSGPGCVLDLSALYGDDEALPLVMLAATSWITTVLKRTSERRTLQIIDEAWAAVAEGTRHFQASLKLARAYGASTWLICHRPADLTAQADDGTSDAKIAAGLLGDIQTRIILRQAPDQAPAAAELLGLGAREADWLNHLVPGRALWRLHHRSAVVQLVLTELEKKLFDTDAAMGS